MKALVLKKIPFGESDLIVHFLLENNEILSGFAAGGRRSVKRFSHQFHIAGLYDVEWSQVPSKQKLTRLSRCELLEVAPVLVSNAVSLEVLSRWATVIEWVFTVEGEQVSFEEVLALQRSLGSREGVGEYHSFFFRQMQSHGVGPELDHCVGCRRPVHESVVFSLSEGGVGHSACVSGIPLSPETLNYLRQSGSRTSGSGLSIHVLTQLDQITLPYLARQMGQTLKSHSFFERLNLPAL